MLDTSSHFFLSLFSSTKLLENSYKTMLECLHCKFPCSKITSHQCQFGHIECHECKLRQAAHYSFRTTNRLVSQWTDSSKLLEAHRRSMMERQATHACVQCYQSGKEVYPPTIAQVLELSDKREQANLEAVKLKLISVL